MQPAPSEHYPLPLHDALPISGEREQLEHVVEGRGVRSARTDAGQHLRQVVAPELGCELLLARAKQVASELWGDEDRKSTRLNSSHVEISYAVFCLKTYKYQME